MSAEDISAGMRWSPTIAGELAAADFGIIVVTRENVAAPWLQFEAGALSTTFTNTFVCPYLVLLTPGEVKGPLT